MQKFAMNRFGSHVNEPCGVGHGGERCVPRIKISGLVKRFGPKVAVDDIDLVVDPGQFVVFLGPSGSGKSTLLRCIAGIETPTNGAIMFDQVMVDGPGCHVASEKRNLAVVFQDYALWPHLSAEQNVSFALERLKISSLERRRRARAMLEQVGLAGMAERYPSQLSGGEQQRVGLARALAADPGILLFDEPLSNLDADRREKLRVDIGAMVRGNGATAVYITHDQVEAFALADVIGVLDSGRLVQFGTPEEIYRAPANAFVARFTGLSGELSGRVAGNVDIAGQGFVEVEVGGFVVQGRPIEGPLRRHQRVQVLIRPFAVRLFEEGSDRDAPIGRRSRIGVTVLDSAFRGSGYEHVVSVNGKTRLTGVPAGRRIPFMSEAVLEIDPEGCLVIADPAEARLGDDDDVSLAKEREEPDRFECMTLAGEL